MNPDYEKRIKALEDQIKQLTAASSFPRDVQNAITTRFGFLSIGKTGSAGNTSSYAAFPVIVPANPSGTLEIISGGKTYNVLLK